MLKQFLLSLSFLIITLFFFSEKILASDNVVENVIEYRLSSELKFKFDPMRRVTFSLSPDLRYNTSKNLTKALVQLGASYKIVAFLSLDGAYRYGYCWEDARQSSYHKFLLGATINNDIERFGTKFRIRYSNDADDWSDEVARQFFRFKASSDYNIKNCKITPKLGVELFQELGQTEVYKYRFSFGLARKVVKNQTLELSYKLDYYMLEYKNKHIVSLNYKFKL